MARTAVTRVIGGHEYTVMPFGAVTGRAVLLRLTRAMGPALERFGRSKTLDEGIFSGMAGLVGALDEKDFAFFCDELSKFTMVKIKGEQFDLSRIFDEHFVCGYDAMLEWLTFALGVNFSGFFHGLRAQIAGGVAAFASSFRKPSIGSSGDSPSTPASG